MTDLEKRDESRKLKNLFRVFFDGAYETSPVYEFAFPVSRMEITDIGFTFKEDGSIEMTVTLCRPGILIGKMGRTIIALEEYLSDEHRKVTIKIIESNLWR